MQREEFYGCWRATCPAPYTAFEILDDEPTSLAESGKAMKMLPAGAALLGAMLALASDGPRSPERSVPGPSGTAMPTSAAAVPLTSETEREVIDQYCVRCHSDRRLQGNLSLEGFDPAQPHERAAVAEKVIVKLRTGMMPPPDARRPGGDTLLALVTSIEQRIDSVAALEPRPGGRSFHRLNRAEYTRPVRDLLGLAIDAADYLPLDTKAENSDNIADVQLLSPTLLDAYLNAAAEISRLAVGDAGATYAERTYTVSGYVSQGEHVEGAPFGTRGGVSVEHVFPADGEYVFRVVPDHTTTGDGFFG